MFGLPPEATAVENIMAIPTLGVNPPNPHDVTTLSLEREGLGRTCVPACNPEEKKEDIGAGTTAVMIENAFFGDMIFDIARLRCT